VPSTRFHTYEAPASAQATSRRRPNGELRIPFVREASLMRVDVEINDLVTAPFYVDTGASGVSLPSHVAEQLGIRVRSDMKHIQVHTAAGLVSRPVVMLRSVTLGGARVENLEATINPAMRVGLHGGEFFNNFVYRVDAAESTLYLRPNERIRGGLGASEWRQRFRSAREPLARLEAYLENEKDLRRDDRARLERRREELIAMLEELELRANKLDVPYKWRQ
jgi:clan AA aspartic protease (TIGR02281 family)